MNLVHMDDALPLETRHQDLFSLVAGSKLVWTMLA